MRLNSKLKQATLSIEALIILLILCFLIVNMLYKKYAQPYEVTELLSSWI